MHHPTFATPDLTTFCRLDELGLEAVGQLLEPDRAVLESRVINDDPWCRKCGAEGVARDTYPAFLDKSVCAAAKGKAADDLLWPAEFGGYLRPGNAVSGWFAGAVKRIRAEDAKAAAEAKERGAEVPPIMPRVTPHDLRHTAASLAISAGANVKAVQRMLGHASAAMTLDTYAELFEDDLDSVAVALDSQRAASLA